MPKKLNLAGQRFVALEVVREAGRNRHGQVMWLCRCGCGKEKTVSSSNLRNGSTQSCGCLDNPGNHLHALFPDYTRNRQCKQAKRRSKLWASYKLTLGQYGEMLKCQGGVCAICGEGNKDGQPLVVDHRHKFGTVRGLLCRPCNLMLGHAQDSTDRLQKAAVYLWESSPLY